MQNQNLVINGSRLYNSSITNIKTVIQYTINKFKRKSDDWLKSYISCNEKKFNSKLMTGDRSFMLELTPDK